MCKGQCPPWQTTVWAPQLTINQDDDETHYVQVLIIKRAKGLVQNYETVLICQSISFPTDRCILQKPIQI